MPYVLAASFAYVMPRSTYNFLAQIWAIFRYLTQGNRRRYARIGQNLATKGTLCPIALEFQTLASFKSYVRFWIEMSALLVSRDEIQEGLSFEGDEALTKWLSTGKGGIMATAHVGNADVGGIAIANSIHPLASVVGPLIPPILEAWFLNIRNKVGVETIFLKGPVTKQILSALNAAKLVAIYCDFDVVGTGLEVEFFSKMVRLPSGPATLSLRTKTPIFPGVCFMTPTGGHHVKILAPIFPEDAIGDTIPEKVRYLSQLVAKGLEELIATAPAQWHVVIDLPIKS